MTRIARTVLVLVAAVLLASVAFAQSSTAKVEILWGVADRIQAGGSVTVRFDSETEGGGYAGSITGKHELTYANNQTIDRKITIEATGIPDGLTLTASATTTTAGTGTGVLAVTVTGSAKNLITGIPGGTTNGKSEITFGATASKPLAEATVVVKYTITAN